MPACGNDFRPDGRPGGPKKRSSAGQVDSRTALFAGFVVGYAATDAARMGSFARKAHVESAQAEPMMREMASYS